LDNFHLAIDMERWYLRTWATGIGRSAARLSATRSAIGLALCGSIRTYPNSILVFTGYALLSLVGRGKPGRSAAAQAGVSFRCLFYFPHS